MSGDTLSDLLRAVRLRGAVFYHIEADERWVAEAPPAREIIAAIMPGAGHMIEFHGIVRGSCWAAVLGEPPVRLEAGDVVLFPQGEAHTLSSAPGMRAGQMDRSLFFTPRPLQLPFGLRVDDAGVVTPRREEAASGGTTVVCGFLGFDARPFNPLLASLPRVLHVPGAALGDASWIAGFLRTAADESGRRRPGGEAVLERMSEMMFVEVLRRHLDALPSEQTGWLAGLRDPAVGRALSLLHSRPAEAWTLESLGEQAGLSRSSLHERFVHFIGQPPMQYLAQWRMQLAAALLRDTDSKLIEIALEVGYENEAAFSRAFKRMAGSSPGSWRRALRSG
ncbi:MAG: AraC family transcriptional regulator [Candidatus Eisenbacteria bacterium]|nr:AraC family transcriptional regulator [Candidatus Eisenbacteria bacterium]